MQGACAVLNCHLSPVRFYHIPRYLIDGTIFGKNAFNINCVLFSLQIFPQAFLILTGIRRDVINVNRSSCKVPVVLVRCNAVIINVCPNNACMLMFILTC
jgi:hypothetical protein